ncbi:uncharacterized protein TM35_000061210 [Trypanosoma theileri]|uniref:TOG domain-containing protein n=1 Tax=Trypanosoma theileri TaxID=67003 RepID=A0A1X0P2F1_9TRYP|nr:uncharacterized protein TM35_000061210 [Trypanosoma theileri]ORC91116.1 hypothetical protein TM35_000061210 [Trypanosoma theileri]
MDQERQPDVMVNVDLTQKELQGEVEWKKQVEVTHREYQRLDDPDNERMGEFKAPGNVKIDQYENNNNNNNGNVYNDPNILEMKAPRDGTSVLHYEDYIPNINNNNYNEAAPAAAAAEASVMYNSTDSPNAQLPKWERPVADLIMTLSGEMEWPSQLDEDARESREATDLIAAVGHFTTACLFCKRFILREKAIQVIMDHMTQLYTSTPAAIEQAVLRFFDMNNYGLQDTIPSVVATACAFVRMVLANEHKCLTTILKAVENLLPRLLCCAADSHPRIREEARRTLVMYVKTETVPRNTILLAILADPIDKERLRWQPSSSITITPRVQVARLMLLEELIITGNISLREHDKVLWTRFLIPCLNHQSQEVRDLALSVTTYMLRERLTSMTPKRASKIYNVTIRDQLQSVATVVARAAR